MNELEQKVTQLAGKYKKPEEFICELEKLFTVASHRKCDFFLQVGFILYKYNYFVLL